MSNKEREKRDGIWQFVLEHERFFCDPPPEGLGFPRPGMVPDHYLRHPDQWALDMNRVLRLKRERQLREDTADRTVSTGMAPGTRQLPGRDTETGLGGLQPRPYIRPAGRHGGRGPQCPGPGAGGRGHGRPGARSAARDRGVPKELGKVLAGR